MSFCIVIHLATEQVIKDLHTYIKLNLKERICNRLGFSQWLHPMAQHDNQHLIKPLIAYMMNGAHHKTFHSLCVYMIFI
jgi:hypothetical protein